MARAVRLSVACLGIVGWVESLRGVPSHLSVRSVRVRASDDDLDAEFRDRVAELGGRSGVDAKIREKRAGAAVGSVRRFLDLEPAARSREPTSAEEERRRLEGAGWASTVAFLGLVVVLAVIQSFRLGP